MYFLFAGYIHRHLTSYKYTLRVTNTLYELQIHFTSYKYTLRVTNTLYELQIHFTSYKYTIWVTHTLYKLHVHTYKLMYINTYVSTPTYVCTSKFCIYMCWTIYDLNLNLFFHTKCDKILWNFPWQSLIFPTIQIRLKRLSNYLIHMNLVMGKVLNKQQCRYMHRYT
jgi:hypothetical protein